MRKENQSLRRGYIPLFRRMQDDPDYLKEKPVSRFEAKIDLLMQATFTDAHRVSTGPNSSRTLFKGQAFVAKRELARRWGWSIDKVMRFFKELASENRRGEPWAITERPVHPSVRNPMVTPVALGTLVTFRNFERLISEIENK